LSAAAAVSPVSMLVATIHPTVLYVKLALTEARAAFTMRIVLPNGVAKPGLTYDPSYVACDAA